MGRLDQFAAAHVAPQLLPGEAIQWIACLMHPTEYNLLGMPVRYDRYIGVATNLRLIALEAVQDAFSLSQWGNVKAQVGKTVHVWWYNELGEVKLLPVHGLTSGRSFYLDPFVRCGPLAGEGRRYCVMPGIDGFDAQNKLGSPFVEWLQQGVARRAFPIDPGKQAALAPLIHAWQLRKQQEQAAEVRAVEGSKKSKRFLKWVAAIGAWALMLLASFSLWNQGHRDIQHWGKVAQGHDEVRDYREAALATLEAGKEPPKKCDYKDFDTYKCICVDAAAHAKPSTTESKRKLHPKLGLWCLDAAGIKSELESAARYDRDTEERVATGRRTVLAATIGGPLVLVVGIVLLALKLRKPKAVAALPAVA